MSDRLRVGSVPYINALPLVHGLADVRFEVPASLAALLHAGELDAALVPLIEYFSGVRYTIVPGIAIASVGPIESVLLVYRTDLAELKTIAVDADSRCSVALVKILAAERFGLTPKYMKYNVAEEGLDNAFRAGADGALIIGDPALRVNTADYQVIDLGAAWSAWTGRSFVYAAWLARDGVDMDRLTEQLSAAKVAGLQNISALAREAAVGSGLSEQRIADYLTHTVAYDLGENEIKGINLFRKACLKHKLIEHDDDIRIHNKQ